jgi:hypothetical protein
MVRSSKHVGSKTIQPIEVGLMGEKKLLFLNNIVVLTTKGCSYIWTLSYLSTFQNNSMPSIKNKLQIHKTHVWQQKKLNFFFFQPNETYITFTKCVFVHQVISLDFE